jgi:hypothetical protein
MCLFFPWLFIYEGEGEHFEKVIRLMCAFIEDLFVKHTSRYQPCLTNRSVDSGQDS